MFKRLMIIAAVLTLFPPAFSQSAEKTSCDRACLENYVDRYMDAMLDNDPSLELFSRDCKFTENGSRLPLGNEGLWLRMTGKGNYKFYVPDVETQQVAFIGTAREEGGNQGEGELVAIAIRLKIVDGLITEAEQIVRRREADTTGVIQELSVGEKVEQLGEPHEIYREAIPEAERASRDQLIETANYYFTGLQKSDGKGYYPFTDDCNRIENGSLGTNVPVPEGQKRPDPKTATESSVHWTCKEQFESGVFNFISRIRDRRFVAVDRERGIVFAFGFFDHDMMNWTWHIAELFRIEKGNISQIEAIYYRCPYGMNSGWSTYEQTMSDQIQSIR